MKKTILLGLVLMMAVSLAACGKTKQESAVDEAVNRAIDIAESTGKKVDEKTKETMKDMIKGSEEATSADNDKMDKMKTELKVSKVYRKCLEKANSKNAAVNCFEKANKLAIKSGLSDGSDDFNADRQFGDWSAEKKASLLKELGEMEEYINNGSTY